MLRARRFRSYTVESGGPVPTLLDIASTPNDLLVMATHGPSGVRRTVLGSVAEGVLRRASGPVITGRTFPEP
jgi:nucleotide-binding universal stress UspA family protein